MTTKLDLFRMYVAAPVPGKNDVAYVFRLHDGNAFAKVATVTRHEKDTWTTQLTETPGRRGQNPDNFGPTRS
jgi:hypothetical protein